MRARLAILFAGAFALAGCGSTAGTARATDTSAEITTTTEPATTTTTSEPTTTSAREPTTSTTQATVPPPPPPPPPPPNCTPGYSPCLPRASDYDCAGGSGNGPAYTGRVTVAGPDIYDLDRDGDGVGCE